MLTASQDKAYDKIMEKQMSSTISQRQQEQNGVLASLTLAWEESPDESLLSLIGSCFAAGDISHISDDELQENLRVLIDLNREQNRSRKEKS